MYILSSSSSVVSQSDHLKYSSVRLLMTHEAEQTISSEIKVIQTTASKIILFFLMDHHSFQ